MIKYMFGLFCDIRPLAVGDKYDHYFYDRPHPNYVEEGNVVVDIIGMMLDADKIVFILDSFKKDYDGRWKNGYTYFELYIALKFFRDKVIGPEWIFELALEGKFFEGIGEKLGWLSYSCICNEDTRAFVSSMFSEINKSHYEYMYASWRLRLRNERMI